MPLEQRPAARNRAAPASAVERPFHLRLPEVRAEPKAISQKPPAGSPKSNSAAAHDSIAAARLKLSEKRFQAGHQQVTTMIEGLRDKRRKVFGRLWIASIVLTGASVVALAVELVQRMNFTSATAEAIQTDDDGESPRTAASSTRARSARPNAQANSHDRSREAEAYPVRAAAYTSVDETDRHGAWLDGTISDNDSDRSRNGAPYDDH